MKNKNIEKRVARKEGNRDIPKRQPKVRVQLMIPYHVLIEIEKERKPEESINELLTNLIIVGWKNYKRVVK